MFLIWAFIPSSFSLQASTADLAKSLGRIGERDQLHKIQQMWEDSQGLHKRLDHMICLFRMDRKRYLDILFTSKFSAEDEP